MAEAKLSERWIDCAWRGYFFALFTPDTPKKYQKKWLFVIQQKAFFPEAINRKQGKVCQIRRPAPLGQNLADITILLMLTTIFGASWVGRG